MADPEGKGCDVYGVIPHRFRAIHILGFLDGFCFFSGNKHKGLKHMVFTQGMYRYRCTHPYSFAVFCLKRYLWRKPSLQEIEFLWFTSWFPRYLDYKALKKVMKTGEGEAGSLWYTKNRWCDVKMGPEIDVVYMIIYDMCSIYVDIFWCTSCGKLFHVFFIWFLCVCVCAMNWPSTSASHSH